MIGGEVLTLNFEGGSGKARGPGSPEWFVDTTSSHFLRTCMPPSPPSPGETVYFGAEHDVRLSTPPTGLNKPNQPVPTPSDLRHEG